MKKKLLSMTLAALMTAAMFAGCGSSTESADTTDAAATETTEASEETGDTGTATGDFTTVSDGVLTMATNAYFPPYEYYEGEEIVGIDAEIAAAVADKLGLTLKIEDMEFDSIITAVSTGKADIGMAGMTVTEDRLKNINFSSTYATGIQSIIVAEDSTIASADDLADKMIGVQLGTTGDIYASEDFGSDHVDQYSKGNDAVMALTQGKVDAVIIDNEPAKSYVAATSGLKILDTEYASEEYAACISKDNDALKDAFNTALDELIADGTVQSIIDKYITAE